MKKTGLFRLAAALLSLLMAVGMMAPAVFAENETVPVELQRWQGQSLQQAAAATGVKNADGNPIFTTYDELIGIRQEEGIAQNVMVHSMYMPVKYHMDDTLILTVRLYAGEEATGTLCWADMIYDAINSDDTYDYKLEIDAATYNAAETLTDPVHGYSYREFSLPVTLEDSIFDMDAKDFQVRFYNFGLADLTLYSMDVYNDTTMETIFTANAYALKKAEHISPVLDVIVPAGKNSGIVTYSGSECFPQRPQANEEPYSKYNSNGLSNRALLAEAERSLTEGEYTFELDFATCYTLVKGDRALFELAKTKDGSETIVWQHTYTHDEAAERVGAENVDVEGMFDHYSVPFTVTAEDAGATYSMRVYATNYTDLYLKSISIQEMLPALIAAVRNVENKIAALPAVGDLTLDDADAVAAARAAFDALGEDQKSQVTNESVLTAAEAEIVRLTEAYKAERAQAAQGVVSAIAAIGTVDKTNYIEKKALIDTAVTSLEAYEAIYSDDESIALITNLPALRDAIAAYEELVSSQIVYGDIDGKEGIDAGDALTALQYTVQLITLDEDQLKAGDVSDDGKVDATDALLILQYTVELIDRFPAETNA